MLRMDATEYCQLSTINYQLKKDESINTDGL